jgi:hypothetical protein
MNWPNEMSGSHPLASWCNKLLRASRASRVAPGVGYAPAITTDGTVLRIESPAIRPNPFRIVRSSTWLKYQVTTGYVITSGDLITPTGTASDFTLTSGVARYWFLIDITATTAVVSTSATTPTWSATKLPIGWVDTTSESTAAVYQFLTDHIFMPCP